MRRRREQRETRTDHVANAVRKCPQNARSPSSIARETQHLDDEERVTFRGVEEHVRVADALCRGPARDLTTPETAEREEASFTSDLGQRIARFRRETRFDIALSSDDDDARCTQVASDEMEQRQRAHVRHVHIVEKDDERTTPRREREEGRDGLEQAESILSRVDSASNRRNRS